MKPSLSTLRKRFARRKAFIRKWGMVKYRGYHGEIRWRINFRDGTFRLFGEGREDVTPSTIINTALAADGVENVLGLSNNRLMRRCTSG